MTLHLSSLFAALLSLQTMWAVCVDSVTVAGIVRNLPEDAPRTIIINECDISDKSARIIAEIGADGSFSSKMPLSFPHTFTVNYRYGRPVFINAYAEPGDSVFFEIDASETPLTFTVCGDHDALNKEYSQAFNDIDFGTPALAADDAPLEQYMAAFKAEVLKRQRIVDNYVAGHNISGAVAAMLRADNVFGLANYAIGYRGTTSDESRAFFTDSIFDIYNPDNTRLMIFPYHLSALMSANPESWRSAPACRARDLMLASKAEDADELGFTRNDFYDKNYYDRVFSAETPEIKWPGIESGTIVILEGDSVRSVEADPLEWITEEFNGLPVYLDISATWCGPCRAALANSESTREHFKDTAVKFVVLWIWSQYDVWQELAPTFHNATQIFVTDEDMSNRLAAHFNIQGVPSCFLMTPEGRLIKEGVPHFNSSELIEYLQPFAE